MVVELGGSPQDSRVPRVYTMGIPGSLPPAPLQPASSAQGGGGVWPGQAPGASVPCAFVSCDTMGGFLSP